VYDSDGSDRRMSGDGIRTLSISIDKRYRNRGFVPKCYNCGVFFDVGDKYFKKESGPSMRMRCVPCAKRKNFL
jgi:hypothetical protein